jgi:2'-5' RNA ligase
LGVVLLVPQPLATEIDGIRRALGDEDRERIPPHVTLVPPVNVHDRDVLRALDVLREAGGEQQPFTLQLGPAATFHPVTPTVYLEVGGDLDALQRVRDAVFRRPLHRQLEHAFVPHATLDANHPSDRIPHTISALASFRVPWTVDRLYLLRRGEAHVWQPFADAPLASASVVARGGLPLELSVTGRPDPEAAALLAVDGAGDGEPFAVTGRRDGRAVGAAWGWTSGPVLELADLAVVAAGRNQGIGRHLLAAVVDLAVKREVSVLGAWAPADGACAALLSGAGWRLDGDSGDASRRRWTRDLED